MAADSHAKKLLQQAWEAIATRPSLKAVWDRVGHFQDVRAIEQLLLKIEELRKTRPRHFGAGAILTPTETDRLHGFLTEAEILGAGDLENGLCVVWKEWHTQREPFGAAAAELRKLAQDINVLEQTLRPGHPSIEGSDRLLKRFQNSVVAPFQELASGREEATAGAVEAIRSDLNGFDARWLSAINCVGLGGRIEIDLQLRVKGPSGHDRDIQIDVVEHVSDGMELRQVKNLEPFTKSSTTWTEEVEPQARQALLAAETHGPATVIFEFPKGVTAEVAEALLGLKPRGVDLVEGQILKRWEFAHRMATQGTPEQGAQDSTAGGEQVHRTGTDLGPGERRD